MLNIFKGMLLAIVIAIVTGSAAVWSGIYNVAADVPHWSVTGSILTLTRNRSIEVHSNDIKVPNLDDPQLISMGAGHYAEMCTGCHLAPGMDESELREGLYPKPPVLYRHGIKDPAYAFWVIKHGIKMTAMPAWGTSHDDHAIWSMVAFLKQLPTLSPAQYKVLTMNMNHAD